MDGANRSYRIWVEPMSPDLLLRYAQMPRPCAGGVVRSRQTGAVSVRLLQRKAVAAQTRGAGVVVGNVKHNWCKVVASNMRWNRASYQIRYLPLHTKPQTNILQSYSSLRLVLFVGLREEQQEPFLGFPAAIRA